MTDGQADGVLALFPSLKSEVIGGIEVSGRMAWAEIASSWPSSRAFQYKPAKAQGPQGSGTKAAARARAVVLALRTGVSPALVLVWHIDLLKLVPFFRTKSARLCLFLHGIEAWRTQGPVTRRLLNRADAFLTNSDYTWTRFLDFYPAASSKRHVMVRLGLDLPSNAYPPVDPPRALMIGRLPGSERNKGHSELIEAWPLVIRDLPAAELWIAGEGAYREALEALVARNDLGSHVRFLGRVSEAEKIRLLRECRCLALPSRGEGFGLVYVEAMGMARPCLVSNQDAGREVVQPPEGGIAVDPDDRADIAKGILTLLRPGPDWDGFSQRARRRYESEFTGAHFRRRLRDALADLMK